MHDPFAMRPFLGYNFGDYIKHWLSMNQPGRKMPKLAFYKILNLKVNLILLEFKKKRIFHVNWFLKSENDAYLWPGFGENVRVLKWILDRVENKPDMAIETPIGFVPKVESLDLDGLNLTRDHLEKLVKIDKQFWLDEADEIREFFTEYVTDSTPDEIVKQIENLKQRIENY